MSLAFCSGCQRNSKIYSILLNETRYQCTGLMGADLMGAVCYALISQKVLATAHGALYGIVTNVGQ